MGEPERPRAVLLGALDRSSVAPPNTCHALACRAMSDRVNRFGASRDKNGTDIF